MRFIDKIILHCADTRTNQNFDISYIDRWHKRRGFKRVYGGKVYHVGYHYYIRLDGTIENGRPIECVGSHCKGQNSNSIGICFEGGKDDNGHMWDKPLDAQIEAYSKLRAKLFNKLGHLDVFGHYEFSEKPCPNFDICILE